MGLFKRKQKDSDERTSSLDAPVDGVDPLAQVQEQEAAAKAKPNRALPTKEQRAYFDRIQSEAGNRIAGSRIRDALESSGLLPSELIEEAIREGGEEAAVVRQTLVQQGHISHDDFMEALADGLGMERVNLYDVEVTPELLEQVPKKVARDYKVFPVRYTESEIEVAIADPLNIEVTDDLQRILQKAVVPLVASEDEIIKHYKRYYEGDEIIQAYDDVVEEEHDKLFSDEDQYTEIDVEADENVPAVVRFVDLIFRQAVHDRASDIHIEPTKTHVTIRFRIDGVLHEVPSPPKKWQNAILSRLKVMSGMDLAEKRIPQDGRIKLNMPDKKLDLRVSCLPSIHGESIVMRILDQSSVILGLEDVGFLPDNIKIFAELIRSPTGVIVMTGPTGSGKTTTLYSALSVLNTPETKIITIENPVEYMLDGVNQIQVNEEVGLDFKSGLRSMLRQSPDVILVGEIRDMETAEIAIRAALTGHLVFSTLHTNDAPSATTRLTDMGVKPFLVASAIQAVIAQRLVRRLCNHCKRKEFLQDVGSIDAIGATEEAIQNGVELYEPVGCDRCTTSGYRGRTAIHEIFVMDSKLRQLVIRGEASSRLKKLAVRNDMRTLRMDGWKKVLLGHTSIEELDRVTAADT